MISELFDQFLKEMQYMANLSKRTIGSYKNDVFKRWMKYGGEMPTKANLIQFVIKRRKANLKTTTVNIIIRSFNSFWAWHHENQHSPE